MSSNEFLSNRIVMHRFCEPYFHAIKRWMSYTDASIFQNRIEVMAMIIKILNDRERATVTFGLIADHIENELLDKVIPVAGATYTPGADIAAFKQAGQLVEKAVFQSAGLFFQNNFLKALAIPNENGKESEGKKSALSAVEILFRLSEDAGYATLTALVYDGLGGSMAGEVVLDSLVEDSLKLSGALYRSMPQFHDGNYSQNSQNSQNSQISQEGRIGGVGTGMGVRDIHRTPSPSSTFTYPTSFPSSSSTVRIIPLSSDPRSNLEKEKVVEKVTDYLNYNSSLKILKEKENNNINNLTSNNNSNNKSKKVDEKNIEKIQNNDQDNKNNLDKTSGLIIANKSVGKSASENGSRQALNVVQDPFGDNSANHSARSKINSRSSSSSSNDNNDNNSNNNNMDKHNGDDKNKSANKNELMTVLGVNVRALYGREDDVLTVSNINIKTKLNKSAAADEKKNEKKNEKKTEKILVPVEKENNTRKRKENDKNENDNKNKKKIKPETIPCSPAKTRKNKISVISHREEESVKKRKINEKEEMSKITENVWTMEHSSIGTIVAGLFFTPTGRKIFHGTVIKYSPCTEMKLQDELFHILWQDGDSEDWDKIELENGIKLRDQESDESSKRSLYLNNLETMNKKLRC